MIIDQLPLLGGDVQGTDEFPIERGTTTYKTTQAALIKAATDAAAAAQLAADNAQDTADEANEKGLPPGGTAGQVLTKADSSNYSASWEDPSGGGDVTADMLGIVIDGNSTPVGASAGQYVIVKGSTITGITDGLYTAKLEIPANIVIDSAYLNKVDKGGLNSLEAYQANKYIQSCSAGSSAKTITLTFESTYPSFLAFGINGSVIIEAVQITSAGISKQLVGTSTNDLNPTKISDSACSFSLKQWGALTIVCGKRFTIS